MKFLRKCNSFAQLFLMLTCLLQFIFVRPAFADFVNGGFEDAYTPDSTTCSPITGWTQTGYYFNGTGSSNPTSINDINLQTAGGSSIQFCGVTNVIQGATQTLTDYFLEGATPTPTLLLPIAGTKSAMINLRSIDTPLTKVGSTNPVTGWARISSQATSLSQRITVQSSDVDPTDGKVHIRFIAAPVLQNPAHAANQQPFMAIQLNNITTERTGSNPLFFQWSFGGQAGVPWKSLTGAGTNSGSASNYQYTDLQAFDIAPGNAFIHVGDEIELIALASGCSPGGHDGHMYLDNVHTYIPPGLLWVFATGPVSSTPGNNVTYTYTYTNTGSTPVDNVQIVVNLPLPTVAASPSSTSFVSVTTPTTGTSPSCSGSSPVTCSIGTLQPGATGTFQLTVNIPSAWSTSVGPVNNGNYPISGTGVSTLLGPLVQTSLVAPSSLSNLVVSTSGLPTTATVGTPYSGTYTCSNTPTASATGDATNASCDITNLPTGLTTSSCTITPSDNAWSQPATIPSTETVTCTVTGTPTASGTFIANLSSNSINNSNSTTNQEDVSIVVSDGGSGGVTIPATVNGSPILSPAVVCCGRPIILGDLPVIGSGPTTYTITAQTGNAICMIGHVGSQTYLKMKASNQGSCTIVGTKNGVTSDPLTVIAP